MSFVSSTIWHPYPPAQIEQDVSNHRHPSFLGWRDTPRYWGVKNEAVYRYDYDNDTGTATIDSLVSYRLSTPRGGKSR